MASASARADGAAPARVRALRERFARVRAATVALARPLSEADASVQSMPDASPTKWHLAHTTWFFETFALERFEPAFAPHDPAYRVLFNSYYNSIGEQHPRPLRGLVTRPGLAEVLAYRAAVDARVERLLDAPPDALCDLVDLGLEHEQQHQELVLTDLQHALAQNPLLPAYAPRPQRPAERVATPLAWAAFDEALCEIGDAGAGFAFDNERPRHRVFVEAFEIASRAVTNGEWIAFVEDGGYATPSLWLSDGWMRRCAEGWEAPLYWQRAEAGAPWERFTLGGLVPAHADEPVCHVSYYEADAFATWAGARLPTEAEWERTAERFAPAPDAGRRAGFAEGGALRPLGCAGDADDASPTLGAHAGAPAVRHLLGHVWEWTRSPYVAYPRFRPAAGALGEYNGKFMADQWVLRGGSCATPAEHVRTTYRNFFPAAARWQFSGLRLARDPA